MTQTQEHITTLQLYWELITGYPPEQERFIRGWLRNATLEEITAEIDDVAKGIQRGRLTAESAGKIISANLRRKRLARETSITTFE